MIITKLIDEIFSRGTQSWKHIVTWDFEGLKVRGVVKRDSYDNQSELYIEVWSSTELKWNRIQSLEGKSYGHLPSAYERDDEKCKFASWDVLEQMGGYAKKILD